MFAQIKMYLYAGAAALVLILAGYAWMQTQRVGSLKEDIARMEKDVQACKDANATTHDTIGKMQDEQYRAGATCDARLAGKDRTIAELKRLMGGGNGQAGAGSTVVSGAANTVSGSGVLGNLDGLLYGQGGGQDGVRQADGSGSTAGAPVPAGQVARAFCVDEVNARNLMANVVLLGGWAADMKTIIDGAQEAGK